MTVRISKAQQQKIVRLFQSGTSMLDLCHAWNVELTKIEAIVRQALSRERGDE